MVVIYLATQLRLLDKLPLLDLELLAAVQLALTTRTNTSL